MEKGSSSRRCSRPGRDLVGEVGEAVRLAVAAAARVPDVLGPSPPPRVRRHRSPTGEPPLGYTLAVDGSAHRCCATTAHGGDRGIRPHAPQLGRTNAPQWLTFFKNVQPTALGGDGEGDDGDDQVGIPEASAESFQLFQGHKESHDGLYEGEKKLCEEVRAGECVLLTYKKKCGQLRSQDANIVEPTHSPYSEPGLPSGAHPFAIERTRAAIRTYGSSSTSPSPSSMLCPEGSSSSTTTSCCCTSPSSS